MLKLAHTHMHLCTRMHVRTCVHTHTHNTHACAHTCMRVHTHTHHHHTTLHYTTPHHTTPHTHTHTQKHWYNSSTMLPLWLWKTTVKQKQPTSGVNTLWHVTVRTNVVKTSEIKLKQSAMEQKQKWMLRSWLAGSMLAACACGGGQTESTGVRWPVLVSCFQAGTSIRGKYVFL